MAFRGRKRLCLRDFKDKDEIIHPRDKISQLPEPVLHKILDFLPAKHSTRTSVLSRRWHRVWSCSLQKLNLVLDNLDDKSLQYLINKNFRGVEELGIKECNGLKNLYVSSYILRTVEIFLCRGLERVDIEAPNLESFSCHCFKSMPCEIKLTASKSMKSLKLLNINITDDLLQDQVSKFPILENLSLVNCSMLESIKISNHSLKRLVLVNCNKLVEVKIDTPNLDFFKYNGSNIVSFTSTSTLGLLEAKLQLYPDDHPDAIWFIRLNQFLKNFNQAQGLTLRSSSEKNVIIPQELQETLNPQLSNIKKLNAEIRSSSVDYVALVDGLLWNSPNLDTLLIHSSSKKKVLKFRYAEVMLRFDDLSCCRIYPIRCWRHFLVVVAIDRGGYQDDDGKLLREFFADNARRLGHTIDFMEF